MTVVSSGVTCGYFIEVGGAKNADTEYYALICRVMQIRLATLLLAENIAPIDLHKQGRSLIISAFAPKINDHKLLTQNDLLASLVQIVNRSCG
ncbi:hypothetical protein JOD20_004217 [Herpetosiphon giganteus]|nr:hypothetical protein [Herpetosiphon giganteus]